jgi:FtsH-binding integral membrane protein
MPYDYAYGRPVAARAETTDRVAFIRRTYAHLGGAILAFMALEAVLLSVVPHNEVLRLLAVSPFSWLFVLGGFMVAGWVAQMWARSETSVALQYTGLAVYVVAQAVIMLPLLMLAADFSGPSVIPTAGILTLAVFAGLTASVFISGKDFSFLRPILFVGSLLALGLIVASILFSFNLGGVFFAFAMVALMSGYILYYTSNVMLYYRTDQHVAAALALFAAVATLFWYILQIVMRFNRR